MGRRLHGHDQVTLARRASAVLPEQFSLRSGLFASHHHLRAGHQADVQRVARFVAGRAVGLVLAGGGARGFAHIGIIKALSLRNPIYRATASYGHFGRTPERRRFVDKDVNKDVDLFTWEQTNRVEDLRLAVQRSKHYASKRVTA